MAVSSINRGPVFRAVDRWDHLAEGRVNPNSISRMLRLAFLRSGVAGAGYTAHSLRRGFATWASRNLWSSKALWRMWAGAMCSRQCATLRPMLPSAIGHVERTNGLRG
jgi:integrase